MTRSAIFLIGVAALLSGLCIGASVRDHFGWNSLTAQSLYRCGVVRGTRAEANLPREMPNSEAECAALERALR